MKRIEDLGKDICKMSEKYLNKRQEDVIDLFQRDTFLSSIRNSEYMLQTNKYDSLQGFSINIKSFIQNLIKGNPVGKEYYSKIVEYIRRFTELYLKECQIYIATKGNVANI